MKHALHLDDRAALRSAIFETLQVIVSLSTSGMSDCFVSFSLDPSSSDGSVPESWERRQLQHDEVAAETKGEMIEKPKKALTNLQ